MTKAVVLLSGGLDSATCLAVAQSKSYQIYAISFDYGQKHVAELRAAERLAQQFGAKAHKCIDIKAVGTLGGSALTDHTASVPDYEGPEGIPSTYVPARNTIMLSVALGWAEILAAKRIITGVSAVDYSNYPDCRPEYIQAFQTMGALATKCGVEGHPIVIDTPLIALSKAETIKLGLSLGVDYSKTVSCYRANDEGQACGQCASCVLRKKGFEEAGVVDPTLYMV